ncbi:MAG: hypothetical protein P1P82_06215 [Bacteroidales bacterium]|nr:hypothetical protein [Bacteroidales bacterium]
MFPVNREAFPADKEAFPTDREALTEYVFFAGTGITFNIFTHKYGGACKKLIPVS